MILLNSFDEMSFVFCYEGSIDLKTEDDNGKSFD